MKFFTCTIMNVKKDGILINDALIVNGVQTGNSQPDFTYLIPEEYMGADIVGKRYIPSANSFETIDPPEDPDAPKPLATIEDLNKVKLDIQEAVFYLYKAVEGEFE